MIYNKVGVEGRVEEFRVVGCIDLPLCSNTSGLVDHLQDVVSGNEAKQKKIEAKCLFITYNISLTFFACWKPRIPIAKMTVNEKKSAQ